MNEFKKKISFDIDDSGFNDLLKTMKSIDKSLLSITEKIKQNEKEALKVATETNKELSNRVKLFKQLQAMGKSSKNGSDELGISEDFQKRSAAQKKFRNRLAGYQKMYDTKPSLSGLLESRGESLKDQAARKRAIGDIKGAQALEKKMFGNAAAQTALNATMKVLSKGAKLVGDQFKKLTSAIKENITQMLDFKSGIATYSANSLITNASARETKMKYGLSDSQAYGFTQAKSMLGIESDEDLMYMNSQQREKLLGYMDKYSTWYEEMDRSGVLANIQEMQLEFAEFKQEIAMEFLSWVSQNKEAIMGAIRGIFEFVKVIANLVMSILSLFGKEKNYYDVYGSDSMSGGTTNNTRTNNININANTSNTVNGGAINAVQENNDKMWSDLAKQIVAATE